MATNMYEDVERSIWKTLEDLKIAWGYDWPIFNNIVTKKDFPNSPAALSIMKISDVPNFQNGGGVQAKLMSVATRDAQNNPTAYNEQPWPQYYDVLYQFITLADNLYSARQIDLLIRRALAPRKGLRLFNSETEQWTDQRLDLQYAGYINRDVPSDFKFWRITNIRFEVPDFMPELSKQVPVITDFKVGTAVVEHATGTVDVVISEL